MLQMQVFHSLLKIVAYFIGLVSKEYKTVFGFAISMNTP
jgi:hypothetical protein